MMSLIKFDSVSYSYDRDRNILSDITLDIEKGSFVSIIGPNGSGKSTFSRLLNGLLIPSSGTVTVDNLRTSDRGSLKEIRRRVGLVFQNPDNQIVSDTVEDDCAFAPENLGLDRNEITERVESSLEMVNLIDKRYRSPNELSGGEKARLSIAGILAMDPDVIVLDEATAMLDERGRREILSILIELKKQGKTVIFITHHAEETLVSDRLLVLCDGRVIQDGTPRDVFSHPVSDRIPLPFTAELASRLSERNVHILDGAVSVDDIRGLSC